MQDSFMNTGDFFLQSGVARVEPFEVAPRVWSLVNTLGWVVLTLIPMLYYLIGLLLSGRLLYFSISCAIFGACEFYSGEFYFGVGTIVFTFFILIVYAENGKAYLLLISLIFANIPCAQNKSYLKYDLWVCRGDQTAKLQSNCYV